MVPYSDVSPAYEPSSPNQQMVPYSDVSPAYEPSAVTKSPNDYVLGGGVGVNDFHLGEQVFFTRSGDLGLMANHPWTIAKKGGRLLTLVTDRSTLVGGGANLTKNDLVQIAKADELVKVDAFSQWEEQRAGAKQRLMEQQYAQHQQQQQQQYTPQQLLPMQQVPQINIKMVGGNDFSNGNENKGSGDVKEPTQTDNAFNHLVIPNDRKVNNVSAGSASFKTTEKEPKASTMLGGLAEFGSLVINKIM